MKFTFIIIVEVFISALLYLTGIEPLLFSTSVSDIAKVIGIGGATIPNITSINSSAMGPSISSINVSSTTMLFGLLAALGIFGGAALVTVTLLGGGGFSMMYIIPTLIAVGILVAILSPIATICSQMINSGVFLITTIGWVIFGVFIVLTMLGALDFIRGGES